MGSPYAPRSPDLSAFHTSSSAFYPPASQQQLHANAQPLHQQRESFSVPIAHPNAAFYPSYPQAAPVDPYSFGQQQPLQPLLGQHNGRRQPHPKSEQQDPSWFPQDNSYAPIPQHVKQEEVKHGPAPGEVEGIVVKTKFPVARIKRIVQADEDVGKVAQVTPVVVSKALELFMISLALKSAEEARTRNSKRVTGFHLKQAVQKDEQFDFLSDIVAKVPDAPTSSGKGKKEDDEDEKDDEEEPLEAMTPAKKGKGAPRAKKGAASAAAGGGGRKKRKEREDS